MKNTNIYKYDKKMYEFIHMYLLKGGVGRIHSYQIIYFKKFNKILPTFLLSYSKI